MMNSRLLFLPFVQGPSVGLHIFILCHSPLIYISFEPESMGWALGSADLRRLRHFRQVFALLLQHRSDISMGVVLWHKP